MINHYNPEQSISKDNTELLERFNSIASFIETKELEKAKNAISKMHYADIAYYLNQISREEYREILRLISDIIAPETIASISSINKRHVVDELGIKRSGELISLLDIEEIIEVVEELTDIQKLAIIDTLDLVKKKQVLEGLTYPENSVGRVVERDFISFFKDQTVGEAIEIIKENNISSDIYATVIVDSRFKPIGTLLLTNLIKSDKNVKISALMNSEFKVAKTSTELDDISFVFKQYALNIVPVVNKSGRLVGTISLDNVIHIIAEQSENDLMQIGGVSNSDIFYNLYQTISNRFPWLFVNLMTACITAFVIDQFSNTITKIITLAAIMPVVASMGGNAGTQVMTITITALISRRINSEKRLIYKEILVCATNGLFFAIIGSILTYLVFSDYYLSIIFGSAILLNFTLAGLLGSSIPIILQHMDIDPSVASSVILTACTDVIGFASILGLAYFFLL